ncbi:thiamine phosphate synthase [Corynebacterium uropygiale]|uniref:Thiamine-phosphate synthase n=1 Tax=Corynebacterium uropygiale TaxID=1775911 RepID=A0A9X1U0X5_9CORY|nr:thiamine phosphate synthase [Corynebacterium uropygiale]MCF4007264.1 thiamine phosphate synthase [Corynebacterium uropygiale]
MSSTYSPRQLFPREPHPRRTREERLALLRQARLYLCTDARRAQGDLPSFLRSCYEGGVDIIQLRDKKLEARAEIEALATLAEIAHEQGTLFAVNDRADVAALVGADILHLGQGDLSTAQARSLLGTDILLGRSNRSEAMFRDSLADDGLDYACMGPVWRTPTKPGRDPVGLPLIARARELAEGSSSNPAGKPWFAIGGINPETLPEVQEVGARRVVVVRALTEAADPAATAHHMRRMLSAAEGT